MLIETRICLYLVNEIIDEALFVIRSRDEFLAVNKLLSNRLSVGCKAKCRTEGFVVDSISILNTRPVHF
jgi:hypothetical protein